LYLPKVGVGEGSSHLVSGAIAGQKISYLFQRIASQRVQTKDFDALPIPFRAMAMDLVTGEQVILDSGDLTRAMRASMSVPAAFDPVPHGDALLVDGGMANNLPADVAREMGADILIVVDVGSPMLPREKLKNALSIIDQLTTLMVYRSTQRQIAGLQKQDILLQPALGEKIGSADFEKMQEAYPIGYAAAEAQRERLAALGIGAAAYAEWRRGVESCVQPAGAIQWVRIQNDSRFNDDIIENLITIPIGEPLDEDLLLENLKQIHALGFIRMASHEVISEKDSTGVIIRVEKDPRGSQFIESGLDLTLGNGGSSFNIRAGFLKTDLDDRGSEFRAVFQIGEDLGFLTEVYKTFDQDRRWFMLPRISYERRDSRLFNDDGEAVLELDIDEWSGSFQLGREFSQYAALVAGIRRYGGTIEVLTGDPTIDGQSYDGGEWWLNGIYDRLDNRYIPSKGSLVQLQYIGSEESLGADKDFEQVTLGLVTSNTM
jgi:NTE family protein